LVTRQRWINLVGANHLFKLFCLKRLLLFLKQTAIMDPWSYREKELTMAAVAEREVTASQDRGALAKMVMALLDHWNLSTEDQAALLGIASSNRAALSNYRSGKPIGTSRDQYERVGHLLGIHKNLRLLFPQNRNLVYQWMSTRNKAFDNLTPVEVVKEWGFAGLLMVRGYLDRARGV
jgi:hypothetical protein